MAAEVHIRSLTCRTRRLCICNWLNICPLALLFATAVGLAADGGGVRQLHFADLYRSDLPQDWLLMEEEFVQNQERLKPADERNEEERTKVGGWMSQAG